MLESRMWGATVGATDSVILPPNNKRVALWIGSSGANRVTIAFNQPAVLDQGLNIPQLTTTQRMSVEQQGNIVRGEVHAIASAGGTSIGGIEVIDPSL